MKSLIFIFQPVLKSQQTVPSAILQLAQNAVLEKSLMMAPVKVRFVFIIIILRKYLVFVVVMVECLLLSVLVGRKLITEEIVTYNL